MFSVGESRKRLWVVVNALFTILIDLFLRTVYLLFFSTKRLIVAHRRDLRELFGAAASAEPKISERMALSATDSSPSMNEQNNELITKLWPPSVNCVGFELNQDVGQNVQTSEDNHLSAKQSPLIDAVFEKVKVPEVKYIDPNYCFSVNDDGEAQNPSEICSSQAEELVEDGLLKLTTMPSGDTTIILRDPFYSTTVNCDREAIGDSGGNELKGEAADDRHFEEHIEEYFNEIVRESMRNVDGMAIEETEGIRKMGNVANDVCQFNESREQDNSWPIEMEAKTELRLIDEGIGNTDTHRPTTLMYDTSQSHSNEDEYLDLSEGVVTAELEQRKSPIENGSLLSQVSATIDGPPSTDALLSLPHPTAMSSLSDSNNKQKDDTVSLVSKCSCTSSSGRSGGVVEVRTQMHKKRNAFFHAQFEPDKQELIRREIGSKMPSIRNIMDRYKRSVESNRNFQRAARQIDIFESLNDDQSQPVVDDNHRSRIAERSVKEKLHVKLAPLVTSVSEAAEKTYVKTPHPVAGIVIHSSH